MTIAAGSRLGPYEILSPLGAGGMGEVYKARDTRLDRTVAIKVLPSHLSSSSEVRQRFEREAKTISQLSHPHICALYDVGNQDGVEYLVMEYLEGETLGDRLAKGPLPLEPTLRYGVEIAGALEKAHRQGIVHRDLKPGNIMLTKAGVKLLDFGLAKVLEPERPVESLTAAPTAARDITREGAILGTLSYMAPEQLEGKRADPRTDIFALGATLYEMATGRKAFTGESQASVISSILTSEPQPISTLAPLTPPALERVVKTCLAKDPEDRWQNAGDIAKELKWVAEGTYRDAGRTRSRALPWAVGTVALLAVAGAGVWFGRRTDPRTVREVTRLEMSLAPAEMVGPAGQFERPYRPSFVLTPDGRRVVFAGTKAGSTQLYMRAFDAAEAVPLAGTSGAETPFLSPDGTWVGFLSAGEIRKTALAGGPVVKVAELTAGGLPSPGPLVPATRDFFGASWGDDDVIVFGRFGDGLWQVPAGGGVPMRMTKPATGAHRLPRVLPRARGILLTFSSRPSAVSVAVVPRSGGEPRILVEDAADARFVAPDHILFVRNGLLMAAPFDVERLALQGPPVALIAGVQQAWGSGRPPANTGAAFFDVSASGTLVYASGGIYPQELTRLVWVDREGRTRPLETPNGSYARPRLSPDGRSIVVVYRETPAGSGVEKRGLATYDLVRGAFNRLTDKDEWSPVWSADGAQIFFFVPGGYGLGRIPADGSAPAEKILGGKTRRVPSSASPDGSLLAVIEDGEGTGSDIALLPLKGERQLRPWLNTPANEAWAEFSPDGRFLAYASDATGRREVYVQPFPGPGARQQVSIDGGDSPLWAHGGRELFFTSHGEKGTTLMAAEVNAGPPLSFGRPHPLFAGPYNTLGGPTGYDVAPDGKSFLMVEALENPKFPTTSLHIVLNWTEELRRMAAGVNR